MSTAAPATTHGLTEESLRRGAVIPCPAISRSAGTLAPLQRQASAGVECAPFDTAAPHSSRFHGDRALFHGMRQGESDARPYPRSQDCGATAPLLAFDSSSDREPV